MFIDPQASTFFYNDSKDLMTWSKPAPLPDVAAVVRHGTVIADVEVGGPLSGTGGMGGNAGSAGGAGVDATAGSTSSSAGASWAGDSGTAGLSGGTDHGGETSTGGALQTGGAANGGWVNAAGTPGAPGTGGATGTAGTAGGAVIDPAARAARDPGCSCAITSAVQKPALLWLSTVLVCFTRRARRRQRHR